MTTVMDKHIGLSLFHISVVAPFFLYVGFIRGQLMPWIFTVLQIMGILLLTFHGYRTLVKWKAHSLTVWVNIFHVVLIAPLLLYIGCMGYDTPRWAYEILIMLGFAAIGYHLYSIVVNIQEMSFYHAAAETKKKSEETVLAAN